MNPNPTQSEIDAFNEKWQNNIRTKFAFEPLEQSEATKEYAKKLKEMPEKKRREFTVEQAKELFMRYLLVTIGKKEKSQTVEDFKNQVYASVKSNDTYAEAMRLMVDMIFGFDNKKLEGKGGIILWSAPGIGKTTILRAACQTSLIVWDCIYKPGTVAFHSMYRDIADKINNRESDLTYSMNCHLFLDDVTEKLNQMSHYGDYKYSLNELIQNRYELWKTKGWLTFLSTNLYPGGNEPGGLMELLDSRSKDRIREMYLIQNMYGESKRERFANN